MILAMALAIASCRDKSPKQVATLSEQSDSAAMATDDSTVYGTCGEGTAMHTLELISDDGDTINYVISDEEDPVRGGLLAGDRLAVIATKNAAGEMQAVKVINLTTLIGHWTSIDKNFEIQEGGVVQSNVKAENHPWTSWKILNGQLLLNRDTFDIDNLGADSLYLENKEGIFIYERDK